MLKSQGFNRYSRGNIAEESIKISKRRGMLLWKCKIHPITSLIKFSYIYYRGQENETNLMEIN